MFYETSAASLQNIVFDTIIQISNKFHVIFLLLHRITSHLPFSLSVLTNNWGKGWNGIIYNKNFASWAPNVVSYGFYKWCFFQVKHSWLYNKMR